jgi:5S rRNA maturation endonuclease (ribonuclease M5)
VLKPHVLSELQALPHLGRELVVLTDPDERGRELRTYLDETIGPLKHAFVPEASATSTSDGQIHAAGNRGIEHVVPEGVQTALEEAVCSFRGRQEFSAAELQDKRLLNAFDQGKGVPDPEQGVAARRRKLCAYLGLGSCRGKELLAALNRYVLRERFESAYAALEECTEVNH